ncbi:MAG TPA: penicillin acylase family protein, partial [Actinomycetota bacterium]|nr:penicillin acylase family protein [Actinomycetota bacterium]
LCRGFGVVHLGPRKESKLRVANSRSMSRRSAAALISATAVASVLVPRPAALRAQEDLVAGYKANDRSVVALNILPPGQGRYMNALELLQAQATGAQPPHNTDQWAMYDSLVQAAPSLKASDLTKYFKDASFGVKKDDVERQYEPRPGAVVVRDASFGVPHIYGKTRSDALFAAGYVSAEDRLFMMDVLRHVGRGRLSEFLGASDANLAMDRAWYLNAGYTEDELFMMGERLVALHDRLGSQALTDVYDYSDGINQYIEEAMADPRKLPGEYEALQVVPEPWLPTDTVAIASVIGASLGVGGGRELQNAAFISALQKEGFSYKQAHAIFDDLHMAEDPEAPVHTSTRFPWNNDLGPVDPKAVAVPDETEEVVEQASAAIYPDVIDGPFGPIRLSFPRTASNALLAGRSISKTGRPLAVFGPQTAYWSPEILMELDIHAPGIDARGVGFPGISLYVLLGRGSDYAWSATSASGDLVDIFAERLCDPEGGDAALDSTYYIDDKGKCVEMYSRTDQWFAKPSAGGIPEEPAPDRLMIEMTTQRTDDGIVQARGMVDGEPVAFVKKRSTWGAEVDSALTYVEIQDPKVINGPKDFRRAFGRFGFTFNWFYLDSKNIAFQLVGYHPERAKGVDVDLPNWGTPRWDWRGRLALNETPHVTNPRSGFIVSWNNKQAPGFRENDGRSTYGRVHRSMLLEQPLRKLSHRREVTVLDLVKIMENAATQDLRGYAVLPYMLKALGTPKEERLARAVGLLKDWIKAGAHRRDLNADGSYDHAPAVALMDAWWERALEAIFEPTLGGAYPVFPGDHDDEPGPVGSAYNDGFYSQVEKDLRTILGLKVRGKFSRIYCGKGKLSACRDALLKSLEAAVAALESEFGADPDSWDPIEESDYIQYTTLGVQGQEPMQWQNRPTFQQVLEFR